MDKNDEKGRVVVFLSMLVFAMTRFFDPIKFSRRPNFCRTVLFFWGVEYDYQR